MYCCDLQEAAVAFPEIGSLRLSSSGLLQGTEPLTTPGTTTEALPPDACRINLEQLTGKYPPILFNPLTKLFVYPTSEEADGSRYLNFGLIISRSQVDFNKNIIIEAGSELELYCHGSEKNQAQTTVLTEGKDTTLVRLSLVCRNQQFVDINTEVVSSYYLSCYYSSLFCNNITITININTLNGQ